MVPLPRRLEQVSALIPTEMHLDAETLLRRHTLYGYMFAFNTELRQKQAREAMMDPDSRAAPRPGGLVPPLACLRYCHRCNLDSLQNPNIQDIYWHRKHQLPGIDVCAVHGISLWVSDVRVGSTLASVNYYAATSRTCPHEPLSRACSDNPDLAVELTDIARASLKYLDETLDDELQDAVRARNRARLVEGGLTIGGFDWVKTAVASFKFRWPQTFAYYPQLANRISIMLSDTLRGGRFKCTDPIFNVMVEIWALDPPQAHSQKPTPAKGAYFRNGGLRKASQQEFEEADTALRHAVREAAIRIREVYPYSRVTKASLAREMADRRIIRSRALKGMPLSLQAISDELETHQEYLRRCGLSECHRMDTERLPILHSHIAVRLKAPRDRTNNSILKAAVEEYFNRPSVRCSDHNCACRYAELPS
jgi:hypothetical protein